jgi:hypothetical protein
MEQLARDGEEPLMNDEDAPGMISRPADLPSPLPHTYDLPAVLVLGQVLASRETPPARALRPRLRSWASHVSGRADRRLLHALAAAHQSLTDHCDLLVDRLSAQETLTSEVARVYGEELARLRAEVAHLSHVASAAADEGR